MGLRGVKLTALRLMKGVGLFAAVAASSWRRERLLILCYHGISLRDEHLWNAGLYMSRDDFAGRLAAIKSAGCKVFTLREGVARLYAGTLPPRSVVVTFDDGNYDFYMQAWPLLKQYGFPATVYLTTYYSEYNRPIFRLICDYMMWKQRGNQFPGPEGSVIDLRTPESRAAEITKLDTFAKQNKLSARDKDELAQQFAQRIGADWQAIIRDRILHIMTPDEATQLAGHGVDLELHTHRHLTPQDETLFRRELDDNAVRLQQYSGHRPQHFCYPSGVHYEKYPGWLRQWGVKTAVTCELGMAEKNSEILLLPRLCDHGGLSLIEFEAWLCGIQELIPKRDYRSVDPDANA